MRYRELGKTGLKISEIGFGCWPIGGNAYGKVKDEDSLEALETAWSAGVDFYDTADTYGEGHSETLVGRFLKGKSREKVHVGSKVGWDFYPPACLPRCEAGWQARKPSQGAPEFSAKLNHVGHKKNFDPAYIRFACEQSLQRLDTGYIDLYQLHNPSLELIQRGETVGVLDGLKKEGKVRFIGISVHTESEALAALEDERVDAIQVIFNLLDQRMAVRVFEKAKQKKAGIIVREPLASGLLTGKYTPQHEFPKDDHRRRWLREKREADWEKVRCLQRALKEKDIPLPRAALEYLLAFDAISSVIPGAKTKNQVLENIRASLEPRLGPEGVELLKKVYDENEIFRKELNPR